MRAGSALRWERGDSLPGPGARRKARVHGGWELLCLKGGLKRDPRPHCSTGHNLRTTASPSGRLHAKGHTKWGSYMCPEEEGPQHLCLEVLRRERPAPEPEGFGGLHDSPRGKTTPLSPPGEGPTPQLLDEELAAILHGLHVGRLPWAMFVPGPLLLHCGETGAAQGPSREGSQGAVNTPRLKPPYRKSPRVPWGPSPPASLSTVTSPPTPALHLPTLRLSDHTRS